MADLRVLVVDDEPEVAAGHAAYVRRVPGFELVGTAGTVQTAVSVLTRQAVDLVLLRPPVLSRASEPMPMPLGTLDAIHLATALLWRDRIGPLPQLMTHDAALGAAAGGVVMRYRSRPCRAPNPSSPSSRPS